jgi:tetratricopeptide (TPR) repeat protein
MNSKFKKLNLLFFVLIVFFCTNYQNSFSQEDSNYQVIIQDGYKYIENGDFDKAKEMFKSAIKINPEKIDGYLGIIKIYSSQNEWYKMKYWFNLATRKVSSKIDIYFNVGNIYFEHKNWPKAIHCYEKVIKINPKHILTHYQLGICCREYGRFNDPISRAFLWSQAKKHFIETIKLDSIFQDVFYEFAHLKFYQENYNQAVELCQTQLKINPQLVKAKIDIFTFYDLFITYGKSTEQDEDDDEYQITWLKKRSTVYDEFFLGEKYRRLNEFIKADSIFNILISENLNISKIPIYLSKVRLLYQINKPKEAEDMFWDAINNLKEFYESVFILNDMKYIMDDNDLRVQFSNIDEIRNYYRCFWNKKNPFPGSKTNMRLEEHYKRLVYAEDAYRFDGPKLSIYNPDIQRVLKLPKIYYLKSILNDKGLVYLRYGSADERAVSLGDNFVSNESWLYRQTQFNPKLIFHFEINPSAKPNDWRLVSVPGNQSMIESRLGWDTLLDSYYTARTKVDQMSIRSRIYIQAQEIIGKAMAYERPRVDDKTRFITMYLSVANFIDDLGEGYQNIYLGIPKTALFPDGSVSDSNYFETSLVLQDSLWNNIHKETRNITFHASDASVFTDDFFIDVFIAYPKVNKFYTSSHIKDLTNPGLGCQRFINNIKILPKSYLTMSDVVLSYDVSPTEKIDNFTRNGLRIIPNPSAKFDKKKAVYLYYEIYNLTKHDGLTNYTIEQIIEPISQHKNILKKFIGLFKSDKEQIVNISRERQCETKRTFEYIGVDFNDRASGQYKITIRIFDNNSNQECESSAILELY